MSPDPKRLEKLRSRPFDGQALKSLVEAGLAWSIQKTRRPGGARAGGYPGADVIAGQIQLVFTSAPPAMSLIKSGRIDPDLGYDWFLPHMSSYFFKDFLAIGLGFFAAACWVMNAIPRSAIPNASLGFGL